MIIPIRCFTCGKVIADKYEKYLEKVKTYDLEQETPLDNTLGVHYFTDKKQIVTSQFKALEDLNIERYCCRRHFLTQVDLIEDI